jgi:hypothetical protein
MVQVDVFWAYGLGAGFAVAASRQLRARQALRAADEHALEGAAVPEGARVPHLWQTPWFVATLLFMALLFAPSGIYLLWEFPSWETMHAGDRSLPAWLVVAFAITNVTQGLLGFWVVERLLAYGRTYLAYLQPIAAYFGMFFILVHGWDGEGYQRFFSPTEADYLAWDGDWSAFLTSDVALTLAGMGVVLLPVLFLIELRSMLGGYRIGGAFTPDGRAPGALALLALKLACVFGVALGAAVGASLLVHALGWVLGLLAFAVLASAALLRPGGIAHRLFRLNGLEDRASRAVAETRDRTPIPAGSARTA